jgi:prophage maintenance system killer protein
VISWYRRIIQAQDGGDDVILDACEAFEQQYAEAVAEIDLAAMRGTRVTEWQKRLPGIVGYRYGQLEEINDIIGYLEIRDTEVRGLRRRHYLEHYERTLAITTVEKYVDADAAVIALRLLRSHVLNIRNKFTALFKQLEMLHYQLISLAKSLAAGVDDAIM